MAPPPDSVDIAGARRAPLSDLERLVRPLLELTQRLTGLESTFLTQVDCAAHQQTVSFALNVGEPLAVEGATVPWNESLCRWAFLTGTAPTMDVPAAFPDTIGAATGLQTFVAVPVLGAQEQLLGCVCGASRRVVSVSGSAMDMLVLVAAAVASQVELASTAGAERRRAEQFEELALIDSLTGLENHRAFTARFEAELAQSGRHGYPLALVLLDVDHFKAINDTFGHPGGDEVLRAVAASLVRESRAADVPARVGGDEFALTLPYADSAGAAQLADRISTSIVRTTAQLGMPATVSIGISASDTTPRPSIATAADKALYLSKQRGRNRAETWDDPPTADD